jgi:hypothetical protein
MPTTVKSLRIEEDLVRRIGEDAKQQNIPSDNEYILNAIEHYLKCKRAESSQAMHLIVTKYDGVCLKCGNKIEKGSWALYGKDVGLICLDDWIQKLGDKAIVAKYLKMRDLKITINALTKEADRLAEKVEAFKAVEKLEALYQRQDKMTELATKYLMERNLSTPEEKELFDSMVREKLLAEQALTDVQEFIKQFVERKKWIRRAEQKTEAHS